MNKDIIQGRIRRCIGLACQALGRVCHIPSLRHRGEEDELIGRLQERYGHALDELATRRKQSHNRQNSLPRQH